MPTRDAGAGRDQVPLGEPADAAAGAGDDTGELVTRHHRAAVAGDGVGVLDREQRRPVGELTGVGSADADGGDLDEQFVRRRRGDREVLDADVEPAVRVR